MDIFDHEHYEPTHNADGTLRRSEWWTRLIASSGAFVLMGLGVYYTLGR